MDDVQHAGLELVTNNSPEFVYEYSKVARIIARIIRDHSHAEDLAVEVFLKVSRLNPDMASVPSVLYRHAVRMALDEVRRRNRRFRLRNLFPSFLTTRDNPEDEYALHQRQLHVGLILKGMHKRDAELLVLRAEGLTYAQLSNTLNINPASVGVMLSRAQPAFKKEYLKRYG